MILEEMLLLVTNLSIMTADTLDLSFFNFIFKLFILIGG